MPHKHICQSCSMPLDDEKLMGTEKDGAVNEDYCIYCYTNGRFTDPGITLDEMIAFMKEKMPQLQVEQAVIDMAVNRLPHLKRWKDHEHIL